jgi:hypothetical protein
VDSVANMARPPDDNLTADARGELARARAEELQQRQADLVEGKPVTKLTAERAQRRAQSALDRAKSAHHDAGTRHEEAGRAHRRAAAAHEQAAMRPGDDSGDAHQTAAEHHRDEADRHDAAALEQFAAEDADARRSR